jgi:hypothetical protein
MILPINTPTQHIIIKTPYWKDRTIGIATHKVREHNEITILAKDKAGNRFYPDRYYLSGDTIRRMPTEKVSNTVLYKIPISDLEVLERADV